VRLNKTIWSDGECGEYLDRHVSLDQCVESDGECGKHLDYHVSLNKTIWSNGECGKYLDQTCEPSTSLVMNTWTKHVSPDKSVEADGESGECQNLLSWSKPGRVRIMEALVLDPLKYQIDKYWADLTFYLNQEP
jgi:hypothetical protein